MTNGELTNRELLVATRTDMKWIKKGFGDIKKLASDNHDRSLKNELDIKNAKWFMTKIGAAAIVVTQLGIFIYNKIKGG